MNLQTTNDQILKLLAENATISTSPQVVPSETIAKKLAMNLHDIKKLLRMLDGLGFITIDIDNQHSLITNKGIQWLNSKCF